MHSALDVANYFLCRIDREAGDTISLLKLQKLVYYAQAWSLVMKDQPLFYQDIEAWSSGPVVRDVWNQYEDYQQVILKPPSSQYVNESFSKLYQFYVNQCKSDPEDLIRSLYREDYLNQFSSIKNIVLRYKSRDIPAPDEFDNSFTEDEIEVLEEVWDTYGELSAKYLQDLVQSEEPWRNARKGLEAAQDSTNLISHEDMKSYYVNFLVEA